LVVITLYFTGAFLYLITSEYTHRAAAFSLSHEMKLLLR